MSAQNFHILPSIVTHKLEQIRPRTDQIHRVAVIYGPPPKGNMRRMLRLAHTSLPLPAFSSRRSLLAIQNLIGAILFAFNNPATIGGTYLIADSTPTTEVFAILRKIQRRSLVTLYVPQAVVRLLLMLTGRSHLWWRLSENLVVDTSCRRVCRN